ncbi:hypothetical protein CY35_17G096400 [Sphagnum magellanicum]|nr:hypothetical protein CY35_17G096400 [Sphagnum magellanicum]
MEFKEAFSSSFELFLFFWLTSSLVHRLVVVRTVACSLQTCASGVCDFVCLFALFVCVCPPLVSDSTRVSCSAICLSSFWRGRLFDHTLGGLASQSSKLRRSKHLCFLLPLSFHLCFVVVLIGDENAHSIAFSLFVCLFVDCINRRRGVFSFVKFFCFDSLLVLSIIWR